jgi:hypothetical protein
LKVDPATGLLDAARPCLSPNRDARPDPDDITGILIHGISLPPGEFGGDFIDRLFTNSLDPALHPYFAGIAGLRVSAHLLLRRDGEIVHFFEVAKDRPDELAEWCEAHRIGTLDELAEILGTDRQVQFLTRGFLNHHIRDRVLAEAQPVYDAA